MKHIVFIIFIPFFVFSEEPWGVDSDLIKKHSGPLINDTESSVLSSFGKSAIRFHQEVISPADGPRSHFLPSSSQYTIDAMNQYGFFKGFLMGCDRLMRENDEDWIYQKIADPNGKIMKWNPVR